MTNEDAIKWLDNLKNDLGNPHYECLWPYAQALDEICEMLEWQEPVQPRKVRRYIEYSDTDINSPDTYDCGNCGEELPDKAKYCPECGRAVKWDG